MSGFRGAPGAAPKGYRLKEEHKGASGAHQFLGTAFFGKGLEGPLGNMYEPIPLPETRRHSFENDYTPNISPSREYVPPEYQGEYKSVLPDWDQPQQMGSPAGFEDPNQYFRGRLRIGQGGVKGVKGATAKRRGGSGSARQSRAPTVENQYNDATQGTGLHT